MYPFVCIFTLLTFAFRVCQLVAIGNNNSPQVPCLQIQREHTVFVMNEIWRKIEWLKTACENVQEALILSPIVDEEQERYLFKLFVVSATSDLASLGLSIAWSSLPNPGGGGAAAAGASSPVSAQDQIKTKQALIQALNGIAVSISCLRVYARYRRRSAVAPITTDQAGHEVYSDDDDGQIYDTTLPGADTPDCTNAPHDQLSEIVVHNRAYLSQTEREQQEPNVHPVEAGRYHAPELVPRHDHERSQTVLQVTSGLVNVEAELEMDDQRTIVSEAPSIATDHSRSMPDPDLNDQNGLQRPIATTTDPPTLTDPGLGEDAFDTLDSPSESGTAAIAAAAGAESAGAAAAAVGRASDVLGSIASGNFTSNNTCEVSDFRVASRPVVNSINNQAIPDQGLVQRVHLQLNIGNDADEAHTVADHDHEHSQEAKAANGNDGGGDEVEAINGYRPSSDLERQSHSATEAGTSGAGASDGASETASDSDQDDETDSESEIDAAEGADHERAGRPDRENRTSTGICSCSLGTRTFSHLSPADSRLLANGVVALDIIRCAFQLFLYIVYRNQAQPPMRDASYVATVWLVGAYSIVAILFRALGWP